MTKGAITALSGAILLLFLYSGNDHRTQLEKVRERGQLIMLTRNGASTYYIGPDGPTGPEVELVRDFSDFLGVGLEIEPAGAFDQLGGLLLHGAGDLIAANLTRTPERELRFNFGPDYARTTIEAVYGLGQPRPRSLADLPGRRVIVIAGSSYEEALRAAQKDIPELSWEARRDTGMEDLLLAVEDGAIDVTLVDADIFDLNRRFYPRVGVAFELPGTLPRAWAFPPGSDDGLAQKAREFMLQAEASGRLEALRKAFYESEERMSRVSMFQFLKQVRERLPPLTPLFREVADRHGMDWRLLAAMAYQESHWNPGASSYTGVRGLMMLTRRTARQLGVADRTDPRQSLDGGARYFVALRKRIPARIPEPDRTWMALAAYNMGMGHLEDARVLTQRQGGNPDAWEDVRARLKLLTQEKWYSQTRYGYARGFEARQYVDNIRSYYETLKWMDTRDHPLLAVM